MEKFFNKLSTRVVSSVSITLDFILGEKKEELHIPRDEFSSKKHNGIYFFLSYERHRDKLIDIKRVRGSKWVNPIAKHFAGALIDICNYARVPESETVLLIPIPLSRYRLLRRGFNQSRALLRAIHGTDEHRTFLVEADNLVKTKETPKQARLSRKDRLVSQKNAFSLRKPERIDGKTVILFDDISTTGTTLKEAERVLKNAGVHRVICVSLAH